MAKQTKQQVLIQKLLARGCKELTSTSGKYRKFSRPGRDDFFFVGSNGALRAGRTASDSISLSELIRYLPDTVEQLK